MIHEAPKCGEGSERMGDGVRVASWRYMSCILRNEESGTSGEGRHCRQKEQRVARGGGRAGSLSGAAGTQSSGAVVGWGGGVCHGFGEHWATAEASAWVSVRFLRLFLTQTPFR